MTMREGRIAQVNIRSAGGFLVADYIAGTTSILIDNADSYPELGGRVIIDTALYDYTSVDKTSGEMVLAAGLVADAEHGTQAVLFPIAEEKIATVKTFAPEEALSCRVPHALYDKIPDGIREVNDQEAVYVTNDKRGWYIADLIAKEPGIDGAYILPGTVTTGDTDPPAYAPGVSAIGALGSIFLRVDPIANADPVEYEWHLVPDAVTLPVAGDAATLLSSGPESQVLVRYLPGTTTPFTYGTTYLFRAFAKDDDGYGPVSDVTSASPVQITAPDVAVGSIGSTEIADGSVTTPKLVAGAVDADKIAANAVSAAAIAAGAVTADKIVSGAVTADKIAAGAVTANSLAALLVLATTIKVGTGNDFTIDPVNGLKIQLPNGGYISLPTSGSSAEFRKVILDATDLLVEDNFELRGASNRISGTLKMSTGVDNPTTGPSMTAIWPSADLTVAGSNGWRGLYDDGAGHWLTAVSGGTAGNSDASIKSIDKVTGAATTVSAATLGIDNTKYQIIDYTRLGAANYVMFGPYSGALVDYVVRQYDNAWAFVKEWKVPTITGRTPVVISNDAVDLFIGYKSNTGGDISIQVVQIPATGAATRTNLVPNPNMEADVSNWTLGPNTAFARSNTVGGQVGSYAGRISSVEQRTNMIPQPLVNVPTYGTTGWAAGSGTASLGVAGGYMRVTSAAGSFDRVYYANSPLYPIVAGQAYVVAYDYGGDTNRGGGTIGVLVRFFDGGGNIVGPSSNSMPVGAGRKTTGALTAPAGAVNMQLYMWGTAVGGTIGTFDIANVAVVKNGESSAAFSGDSGAGYYWTGAANGSTSVYHPAVDAYVYSPFMSVQAAKNYIASVYSRGSAANNIVAGINWYDSGNNYLSQNNPAGAADGTGGFTRFNSGVVAAPAGAAKAILVLYSMALPRGEYHYFDAVMFEQASALGAYFDGDTVVGGQRHAWLGTAGASASEESIMTTLFTTAASGTPLSNPPVNLWIGTADLGSKQFIFNSVGAMGIWDPAGARGATQTDREWAQVGAAPTIGLAWDGAKFRAMTYNALGGGSFTNSFYALGARVTAQSVSGRYSQYDSNATGGTHETAWSNAVAFSVPARQLLKVTTPEPQGAGGQDEPDRMRHYLQIGGAGNFYRQADITASPWSATYDAISTAGATATSLPDFTGLGNPGIIQAAKLDANGLPVWSLRGDGVIHMFPGEVRGFAGRSAPLGTLKCDGTSYLRSLFVQLFSAISFTRVTDAASHPAGINTIYLADTSDMAIGMQVEGTGIPNGSTITAIVANTQITISNNTTAAIAGATITIIPHGAADSTHFNVPDYRGRTLVGVDGTTEFAGIGTKFGAKTHTLVNGEMPVHSHGGGTGYVSSDHSHNLAGTNNFMRYLGSGGNVNTAFGGNNSQNGQAAYPSSGISANHWHGINNDGGGGAHNNVQPSAALNWIIAW